MHHSHPKRAQSCCCAAQRWVHFEGLGGSDGYSEHILHAGKGHNALRSDLTSPKVHVFQWLSSTWPQMHMPVSHLLSTGQPSAGPHGSIVTLVSHTSTEVSQHLSSALVPGNGEPPQQSLYQMHTATLSFAQLPQPCCRFSFLPSHSLHFALAQYGSNVQPVSIHQPFKSRGSQNLAFNLTLLPCQAIRAVLKNQFTPSV